MVAAALSDPNLPSPANSIVVVVTYGERFHFLEQVVHAVLRIGIAKVVIVDNASPLENHRRIGFLREEYQDRIEVLRLGQNRGSAGGFRAGLEWVMNCQDNSQFLWLLDDDNRPEPNAFEQLRLAYSYLGAHHNVALLSLRSIHREFVQAAMQGREIGIKSGSFLGFHIVTWIVNKFRRSEDAVSGGTFRFPLVEIGYAPYGGLLFHRQWLTRIGLPNEKFFLYSDDHDFTMRMRAQGAKIYLCAASQIDDLEPSWGGVASDRGSVLMNRNVDERKLYYFIRNRSFLEARWCSPSFIYWFNVVVVLAADALKAILSEGSIAFVARRLRLTLRALKDGHKTGYLP